MNLSCPVHYMYLCNEEVEEEETPVKNASVSSFTFDWMHKSPQTLGLPSSASLIDFLAPLAESYLL